MKLTSINARVDKDGQHNDRNFDLNMVSHINKDKVHLNRYYRYNGMDEQTFKELELDFYSQHFADAIELQNEKNDKNRNSARNKTIEQYWKGKNTRPEDKIIQIGNYFDHVDGDVLWDTVLEYIRQFDELYGENCKIVDAALHMDEATPHVHIRRVWIAHDENGNEIVSQRKALEEMGFLQKDEKKESSRFNNRKITFTKEDARILQDACKLNQVKIETSTPEKNQKHLSMAEYKMRHHEELDAKIAEMEAREREMAQTLKNLEDEEEALELTKKQLLAEIENQIDPILEMFEQNAFLRIFEEEMRYAHEIEDKRKRLNFLIEMLVDKSNFVLKGDYELMAARVQAEKNMAFFHQFLRRHKLEDTFKKEWEEEISNNKNKSKDNNIR